MKIAVLGANGFLGKFITRQLTANGYTVLPVTRQVVDLTNFLSVTHWLDNTEPYAIINCATAMSTSVDVSSHQDIQNNLDIFLNFYNNGHKFTKFINVGSGAEFDRRLNIDNATEDGVLFAHPKDSYGYSKNVMARLSMNHEKFYTLRLFGCFDSSEPEFRVLQRCRTQSSITISNRMFDTISASDFVRILDYYCSTQDIIHRDINCVYPDKVDLETIVTRFASIHNKTLDIQITNSQNNYTGSGSRLRELGISLEGLDQGLEKYI